ncbi:linoleate 13S-lipoxygenase 2-1, chloroplastic-like protein [Tanacetum coccineum]|uniref:Linoleate 13S-lipoxygenase 2-1, chloroplastic-like protein n=1 Tax=Tanacetum coccineum TaxID=301880 RepID=A0ABQ5E1B4_9ASTR
MPKTDREVLAEVTQSTNHAHIAGVGRNLAGTGNLDSERSQPDQVLLHDLYTLEVFPGSISTPGGPNSTSPAPSSYPLGLGNSYTPTFDTETSQSGEQDDNGSDDGNREYDVDIYDDDARTNMPNEDHMMMDGGYTKEWKSFLERPEAALLQCFPSQVQAMKVMSLLNVSSDHSPDEIYVGGKIEPAWDVEPAIKRAFEKFSGTLKELEVIIDKRNEDPKLKNRSGAGILPYQLLNPYSAGDTKKGVPKTGVPNSVSI